MPSTPLTNGHTPEPTVDAILARARTHLGQGDSAQAVHLLTHALARHTQDASLWTALGVALRFEARLEVAASAFAKALALEPGQAEAQVYLGMIRLAQGRQAEGWPLYQARWRARGWPERMRYPPGVLWQGRVSAGTRLLLWAEQGLGDTLQFARYAPWLQQQLHAQGASLVLEVPRPLQALLQQSWPALEIAAMGQVRGRFDVHLPLMDLPNRWGGTGPPRLPYQPGATPYLSLAGGDTVAAPGTPCPTALAHGSTRATLKVGLAWQGRPSHPDDALRSLPAAAFAPLFEMPGLAWTSLQKDAREHPAWLPQTMAASQDFLDTARVVQGLDVVISIDSAIAHLAGAMGKPVCVLLPPVPDWRWGLSAERTPWYPSMRLFRRGAQEGWNDVMRRIGACLSGMLGQPAR
jgi:hypothetical protein